MPSNEAISAWSAFGAASVAAFSLVLATCEYRAAYKSSEALREMELSRTIEAILLENQKGVDISKNIYGLRLLQTYKQNNLISPETFTRYDKGFCEAIKLEAFENRWNEIKTTYDDQFRAYIDMKVESCQ